MMIRYNLNLKFTALIWGFALAIGLGWETTCARTSETQIVGGRTILIQQAPWQMLLRVYDLKAPTADNGAAVWIGGKWALTAAHVVAGAIPAQCALYAGLTRAADSSKVKAIRVVRIYSHPEYVPALSNRNPLNDIALLELASAPISSPSIAPIRCATSLDVKKKVTDPGVSCIATGWGGLNRAGDLADSLQSVTSIIKDTTRLTLSWAGQGGTANIGSCGGDSGGPLVVKDASGTGLILAGISSYINSFCGDPKSPSSYSRVSAYENWIQNYVSQSTRLRAPILNQKKNSETVIFSVSGARFYNSEKLGLTAPRVLFKYQP